MIQNTKYKLIRFLLLKVDTNQNLMKIVLINIKSYFYARRHLLYFFDLIVSVFESRTLCPRRDLQTSSAINALIFIVIDDTCVYKPKACQISIKITTNYATKMAILLYPTYVVRTFLLQSWALGSTNLSCLFVSLFSIRDIIK